jgi:hypothetical protein
MSDSEVSVEASSFAPSGEYLSAFTKSLFWTVECITVGADLFVSGII